jgi:ATP-dependent DNA ligase
MLLTVATEDDLERFITDNKWAAQEKMNGKRIMVRAKRGKVVAANKTGKECPIPAAVADALSAVEGDYDGELVRGKLHLFDAMRNGTGDLRGKGMAHRHEYADAVAFGAPTVIGIVPLVTGTKAKRALVAKLKKARKEGVVFKKVDAPYEAGRRSSLKKAIAVKVKFYAEASLRVIRWNGKQSVQLGARDGIKTVFVGNMTVPEKYNDEISAGDIVRVRYLYATEKDRLYQPNLDPDGNGEVVRDDVLDADALSSLKHEGIED